jgi:hypothetical protein
MASDHIDTFVEVLSNASELPDLRSRAAEVRDCEVCCIDESYLSFLDEQIQLNARGSAWTERLKRRREELAPFCGVPLLSGSIRGGTSDFTVYIDPEKRTIAYWEEYPDWYETP